MYIDGKVKSRLILTLKSYSDNILSDFTNFTEILSIETAEPHKEGADKC